MVSVCLPSDALLQHLPSYLGFSYVGRGVSLHGCSSKAQPLVLTFDKVAPLDSEQRVAPLCLLVPMQLPLLGCGVAPLGHCFWPQTWGSLSWPPPLLRKLYIAWLWFSSVEFNSVPQLCLTLCDPMNHSMPGLPVYHQLPEFTQTHAHWVGDAIQPSHPLSFPSPPAPNPSQHQVFSNESVLRMRWPKYWSFSFNISPTNEHPGLISFRMDWLDLLAVQGTLQSHLQHHRSKHQFSGSQLSLESNSHIHTWLLEKP